MLEFYESLTDTDIEKINETIKTIMNSDICKCTSLFNKPIEKMLKFRKRSRKEYL